MTEAIAAIDLGATSGRVVLGWIDDDGIRMETVARFPNEPVCSADGLHWNIDALYAGALDGLREAFRRAPQLRSIGVDSWAVDYGLLRDDALLAVPFHYRDERTAHGVELVHGIVDPAGLYRRNGLQFLPFNTLYQLAVEREAGALDRVEQIALIPDLIVGWLTGTFRTERTNASTTGLLDARSHDWDAELMAELGIRSELWPPLVSPGEVIGQLRAELAEELGGRVVDVIAVGSHDTASAVVGVPLSSRSSAYISCGTWGLVGLELDAPVLSEAARVANFTNELGVDGRIRFLHNVMGLWLLSESVRAWNDAGEQIELTELLDAAATWSAPVAVFDVNDPRLLAPGDLPGRIADCCLEAGQPAPQTPVEFVRSIIESLARAFAAAVVTAGELAGIEVDVIHLVGGGALNELLCQRLADVSGLDVFAGPVEATALGNLLVQARALGLLSGSLEHLRELVRQSHPPIHYRPGGSSW
ncbi:MAG: rhamnulokinase [Microbacteriaceae bacterium]